MKNNLYKQQLISEILKNKLNFRLKNSFDESFTTGFGEKILVTFSISAAKRCKGVFNSNINKYLGMFNPDTDMMLGYYLEQYFTISELEYIIFQNI